MFSNEILTIDLNIEIDLNKRKNICFFFNEILTIDLNIEIDLNERKKHLFLNEILWANHHVRIDDKYYIKKEWFFPFFKLVLMVKSRLISLAFVISLTERWSIIWDKELQLISCSLLPIEELRPKSLKFLRKDNAFENLQVQWIHNGSVHLISSSFHSSSFT